MIYSYVSRDLQKNWIIKHLLQNHLLIPLRVIPTMLTIFQYPQFIIFGGFE